ncbi:MAG: hypothetical protein A2Z08_11180 [Deltaproteobacteria bacterium RBG_16_54_11]|nr:MAG: hypothetical protein A2Z08_11180 [Deltaproteobacteria bacterium RBG_16_54_11]
MKVAKAIFIVLLFFFALTFCLQNADEVTLRYYGLIENVTAPIFIVVLASVFLGIIIGLIGGGLTNIRLRIQLRRQTKEAEALRQELDAFKGEEGSEP